MSLKILIESPALRVPEKNPWSVLNRSTERVQHG